MNEQHVPCNGCTLCCHNDVVRLLPQDDPSMYFTEPHPFVPGALMLAHDSKTQDCIYLRKDGCGIHPHRPQMCREMDCRRLVKYAGAVGLSHEVIERGKELLALEETQ